MSLGKRAKRIRHELVCRQRGRCYYCHRPFGKNNTPHAATIEHLTAKMDGGTDRRENLVAIHLHCNQNRGRQMNAVRQRARGIETSGSLPGGQQEDAGIPS